MSMTNREVNDSNTDLKWQLIGLIILPIRFVQGFIFWAGGSRRFIYAPQKLDPHAPTWLANKLQSAMPGALFGLDEVIAYLLNHFVLLYSALIIFSLIELVSGTALLIGFFTRTAAFITVLLSITMMLIFGWEGATCLDEWTMAACTFAIGLTLVLSGASIYSVDHHLIKRDDQLTKKTWFKTLASGPINFSKLNYIAIVLLILSIIFICGTYNYYRGAIFSRYHTGPVSATTFHLKLDNGYVTTNGEVIFTMYVDAGTSAVPNYIVRINLVNAVSQEVVGTWSSEALSNLPLSNIKNKFDYNRISVGRFGLIAPVGAKALIILPANIKENLLPDTNYYLQVVTVDGKRWSLILKR